jgi:hypothetical protein
VSGRRALLIAVLAAAFAGCSALVSLAGAGHATGSRELSALRSPSIAPLPLPFAMPAAKAARFRAMDRLRQRAAAIPATPPTQGSTAAGLTAGILGLHDGGPFSPSQFLGTNLWNGPVRGRWLVVQAGGVPVGAPIASVPFSRARAAVFVYWRPLAPDSSAPARVVGIVRAPGHPVGELVAERERGGVLTLSLARSGRVYRFDLRRLGFERA